MSRRDWTLETMLFVRPVDTVGVIQLRFSNLTGNALFVFAKN